MNLKTHEKIVIYRHRRKWTQDALARRAHMSLSTIKRIECGKRELSSDELKMFASIYGVLDEDLSSDS